MRRLWLRWLVPVVLAVQLPCPVSAHSPADVQITSPGVGVWHLRTGETLDVTVQYTSQPAVAGSTALRVEMFHQILKTVAAVNTVTAPDGVNQQVSVPLSIPPGTPETPHYRLRVRVTNSDNPVEGAYTASGGAFTVDAGPPDVEVLMAGAGDAPVQPLSNDQIQMYGHITDVSTGLSVRTEVAPAGSGVWSQTSQVGLFFAPVTAVHMGSIPVADLADGSYDLRVTVTDGAGYEAVRETTFTLAKMPAVAPNPPRNLQAEALVGAVRLRWRPPAGGGAVQSYQVIRNGAVVAQPLGATSALIVTADANVTYQVVAVNSVGVSAPVSLQASPRTAPPPPAAVAVLPAFGWNEVAWVPPAGIPPGVIVSYRVYRNGVLLAERGPYSYYDNSAVPGETYEYQVTAFTSSGESPPDPGITVTSPALPDPPGLPAPTISTDSAGTVTLTWSTVANMADPDWDVYDIYRDGVWLEYLPYPATIWKDVTAVPGTTYTYAIDACNFTACTDPVSVTITAGADTVAPVGTAGALPASSSASFDIPWTAGDGDGSGVVGVTLYYSPDGGQTWMPYGGTHTMSPIAFVAPAAGSYAFSITAVDAAGNAEAPPMGAAAVETSTEVPGAAPDAPNSATGAGAAEAPVLVAVTVPSGQVAINDGDPTTPSSDVTLYLLASGAVEMRFAYDGTAWGPWEPYAPTRPYRFPEGYGRMAVYVQFRNEAGVSETVSDDIIVVDAATLLPRGTVLINAGAPAVSRREVELTLRVLGAPSGVGSLRLSDDGTTWADWEAFREQREHTMPPGDGRKTVYVQFRDPVGNYLASAQFGTLLDTTPPAGLVVLEAGSGSEAQVHALAHDSVSAVTEMRHSTNGSDWSAWTPYRPVWSVSDPVGQQTPALRVELRDLAGNVAEANVVRVPGPLRTATELPDAALVPTGSAGAAPPVRAVQPVVAAPMLPYYGSAEIEVQWSTRPWSDSEVTGVRLYYTTDGGQTWAAYGNVFRRSPIPFLAPGAGVYGFAVRPERAGPEEAAAPAGPEDLQAITTLDLTPPTGSVRINDGALATAREEVLLLLSAADSGAGVTTMRFSHDRTNWTGWEAYRPVRRWVLSPGTGIRQVCVQFRDQAGNISEPAVSSIRLELVYPEPRTELPRPN